MTLQLGVATLLAAYSAQALRQGRKIPATISGVPVFNFEEAAQDWSILFRAGATDEDIKSLCAGRCDLMGHPSEGGVPFAHVHGNREKVEAVLKGHKGNIELVEPDAQDFVEPITTDDMEFVRQSKLASWGLDMTGVANRPNAGRGVHIYVQDTGVRVSHRDFGGRATSYLDFTSGSMVMCEGNQRCAADGAGHGTHVAGTCGGTDYGVASASTLYAIKTLSDAGSGQRAWNIGSIDYITASGQKPAVINLSLGGKGQDVLYDNAISAATARGVVVVVAAGNFGSDSCTYSPAFVPKAITVGAIEGDKRRAGYSNFGDCNDIMAPGSAITSASPISDTMNTRMTGTSMACPHVAGGAAVLMAQFPWYGRDQIVQHMTDYGRKGFVVGLRNGDPDLLLWVGKEPAPGEPECPEFATTNEPNYWGDCQCPTGQICSTNGATANCPSSMGPGGWEGRAWTWNCTTCECI